MKSQTTLVSRNCRLNEWARMVHNRKNRPAGMSIDEWFELNSITKANYYYRMKQVRAASLDALPSEESTHAVVFLSLELMKEKPARCIRINRSFCTSINYPVMQAIQAHF